MSVEDCLRTQVLTLIPGLPVYRSSNLCSPPPPKKRALLLCKCSGVPLKCGVSLTRAASDLSRTIQL